MAGVTVGVILAGGQSHRMGGGDKGLREIGGKSMLAHVVERLRPQVDGLVLNANGDPARFSGLGLPVVADMIEGFVGPLAGVLAGLRWAAAAFPSASHIATAVSDVPLLPRDLVDRLGGALAARPGGIAIVRSGGVLHPVIGLWPVALADDLEADLRAGVRKVQRWTDKHGAVPVDFAMLRIAGTEVDPFFNANTPQDLDTLRALRAAGGGA